MRETSYAQAQGAALALGSLRAEIHVQVGRSSTEELTQVVEDWSQLSIPGRVLNTVVGTEQSIRAQEATREIAKRSEGA